MIIPSTQAILSSLPHTNVQDWAMRVVKNGGVTPSWNTINSLSNFMNGMDRSNLTSKMKIVNCFVPDNLIASLTPLIVGGGRDPWLNSGTIGFVSTDLTANGLVASLTTNSKYLKTGFNSAMYNNTGSCGLSLYNSTEGSTAHSIDFGCSISASHMYMAVNYLGLGLIFDCLTNTTPRLIGPNTGWSGFLCGNKTSATDCRIDQANSTTTYYTHLSQSNASGGATNDECFMFDINPVQNPSNKRFSFASMHDGLSFDEGQSFYNLVQTMRQQLGGGFV